MRTLTLEEHFATDAFYRATGGYRPGTPPQMAAMQPKLLDLGAGRLAAMDEAGIDYQVLSLASMGMDTLAAETATPLARDVNDELVAAIAAHPTRFGGFATLALQDPQQAAKELERCITRLGFLSVMLDGTSGGLFLDDARFTPIWEAAAQLGVPVYLHPALPPEPVKKAYYSGLPDPLGQLLSIAGWGWHAELGLHTLRLIVSGLFDRLPTLQLIIGHMGEGLPYALARSSAVLSHAAPSLRQPVANYFKTNIHLTTSGYFTAPPLKCALEVIGIDRMMFSIDYPFSPNTRGRAYLDELQHQLPEEDFAKLTHANAEKLLNLRKA
jgi:predicted TIM-barrel fold metal-dependent hydrolase